MLKIIDFWALGSGAHCPLVPTPLPHLPKGTERVSVGPPGSLLNCLVLGEQPPHCPVLPSQEPCVRLLNCVYESNSYALAYYFSQADEMVGGWSEPRSLLVSSFFKRLGGLLLVRACYGAKRKDFLSGFVCTCLYCRLGAAPLLGFARHSKPCAVQTLQGAGSLKWRPWSSVSSQRCSNAMGMAPSLPQGAARGPSGMSEGAWWIQGAPKQLCSSPPKMIKPKPREVSGVSMLNLMTMDSDYTKPCCGMGSRWRGLLPMLSLLGAPELQRISVGQPMSIASGSACAQVQANEGVLH